MPTELAGRTSGVQRVAERGVLTVVSLITVGLGVWLPWLIVEPGYDGPVPQLYISGMETGIAGQDYVILGVATVGLVATLALSTCYRRRRLGGLVRGVTGLLIVSSTSLWIAGTTGLDALWWFVSTNAPETGTLDVFVLGAGVYLTLFGGLLLLIGGGAELSLGRDIDPNER